MEGLVTASCDQCGERFCAWSIPTNKDPAEIQKELNTMAEKSKAAGIRCLGADCCAVWIVSGKTMIRRQED